MWMSLVISTAIAIPFAAPDEKDPLGHGPLSASMKMSCDGSFESGWVVTGPASSSDYFSTRFSSVSGSSVITSVDVSVGDFGTSASGFASAGIFRTNLAVDPTGRTPDLSNVVLTVSGTIIPGLPLLSVQHLPAAHVNAGGDFHVTVQFPPGDPGLLAVGADTDTQTLGGDESPGSPNPFDSSAFTSNGYSTPAATFDAIGDFGLGYSVAPSSLTLPHLQFSSVDGTGSFTGDYSVFTTQEGHTFGLSFWGNDNSPAPTLWLLFLSVSSIPVIPIGSVLPSISTGDGATTSIRLATIWPSGAGNLTLTFVAVSGSPGVIGSIGVTNEITLYSLPDPITTFGNKDDGSYESGWTVAGVAGSSDYFSTPWGTAPGSLSSSSYSVMDFGTTFSSFPRAGQAPPNLAIDAAGNTPDLGNPYVDQPLLFPALTFVSTSGQLVSTPFSSYTPGTDVLEFIQLPPTDPSLLGLGADTNNAFIDGLAGWSLDGYSTAANLFALGNWGMRTQ